MKTQRQLLVSKLDKTVKQIIYKRDKDICQHCGKGVIGSNRHASHVIPVSAGNKLRWDPQNMKVLCYHCHINWWHKNPLESAEWFKQKFPQRWEYLNDNRGLVKLSVPDLQDISTKLQNDLVKDLF